MIGEYVVLDGGQALIAAHAPHFELRITPSTQTTMLGINPDSPSGRLLTDHRDSFAKQCIEFYDPHQGRGGFGASSAQFLGILKHLNKANNIEEILDIYWHYHLPQHPSGADIITQYHDGLICYDTSPQAIKMQWPFTKIGYMMIATGQKIATHEHLSELTLPPLSQLKIMSQDAIIALTQSRQDDFINAINDYHTELIKLKLCAQHTQSLLKQLGQAPILAAKGCGAMGHDVIILFYKKHNHQAIVDHCKRLKLNII